MDCKTFESAVMADRSVEPDRAPSDAERQHLATCSRCSLLVEELRAKGYVAARTSFEALPRGPKAAQVLSLAGRWAMRPQTAMASVFLVMLASSVLLLRGKSARAPATAQVIVTERGTPAPPAVTPGDSDHGSGAARGLVPFSAVETRASGGGGAGIEWLVKGPPSKSGPPGGSKDDEAGGSPRIPPSTASTNLNAEPTGASAAGAALAQALPYAPATDGGPGSSFDVALSAYRAERYDEAARAFDALVPHDSNAELWAARSIREAKGCRAAIGRFDRLAQSARQTAPGWDALLEGALCHRALGDLGGARGRLSALLGVDSHKDRAAAELDRLDPAIGKGPTTRTGPLQGDPTSLQR